MATVLDRVRHTQAPNTSIAIDRNVPLPERHGNAKYPFSEMSVGDSFFLAGDKACDRLKYASAAHGARYSKKFVVRAEGNGARIWRTA